MAGLSDIYKIFRRNYQSQFGNAIAKKSITGTSAVLPDNGLYFESVQIWTANTRVASFVDNGITVTDYAAVDLPSGFTFYGQITSVTLSTGTARGYQAQLNQEGLNA
jgi:hypothetical protein